MNLLIVPFHDWKKSENEGFRTRDVHFINALSTLPETDKILVINRPTTRVELFAKKQSSQLKGKVLLSSRKCKLYQVGENKYVTTYLSSDYFNQAYRKHRWFTTKYIQGEYIDFIEESLDYLNIDSYNLLLQNVFAFKLVNQLHPTKTIFDAWDNFLKFPRYSRYQALLLKAYHELSDNCKIWITNSQENKEFFTNTIKVKRIEIIKNGVLSKFQYQSHLKPRDLEDIPKPIFGFGGKVTYLLDYNLINYLTQENPQASFVFVGQILNKKIYRKIIKRSNVYFLGDKHYDIYPCYVMNFDICIIPYKTGDNAHGGDSIKAYEFLLAGKKVVGTVGNGLCALSEYLYLANTPEEFSKHLKNVKNEKPLIDEKSFSWKYRSTKILELFEGKPHVAKEI